MVVLNGYKAVKDGIVTHSEEISGRPLTPFYRDMMGEKGTRCHTILKYEQDVKTTDAFLCMHTHELLLYKYISGLT